MSFEPNVGQSDRAVKYLARGAGYTVLLLEDEAVLALRPDGGRQGRAAKAAPAPAMLRMHWKGGRRSRPVATDRLPGVANYLTGPDPTKWHTDVPTFAKVRYDDVYAGIDMVFYGTQGEMEYDFVVEPGASPAAIRLTVDGAASRRVDADGNLVLRLPDGKEIVQRRPVLYQQRGGAKAPVEGAYAMLGNGEIGFTVGAYDKAAPLVIDPVIAYSTYIGGKASSMYYNDEEATSVVAVDGAGATYVAGYTRTLDLVGTSSSPLQPEAYGSDMYIMKIDPTGATLEYSTYLGGIGAEYPYGIAVDSQGSVFVAGQTTSPDFPGASASPIGPTLSGTYDAILTRIAPDGGSIGFSTYLGGSDYDEARGVAIDATGRVVVLGVTSSYDIAMVGSAPAQPFFGGGLDLFVTAVAADGSAILASTYYGGSGYDIEGAALALDASGDVYLTGTTDSFDLPGAASSPIQPTPANPFANAYVARLGAGLDSVVYATYLSSPSGPVRARSIAVDAQGRAFIAGDTFAFDYPVTPNALQPVIGGFLDAFVTGVEHDGSAVVYSSFLGGTGEEFCTDIAINAAGVACVVGQTNSFDLPGVGPTSAQPFGYGNDAFLATFNVTDFSAGWSTYVGGFGADSIFGVELDAGGNAYAVGQTSSFGLLGTSPSSIQPEISGAYDGFAIKIAATGDTVAYSTYLGGRTTPATYDTANAIALDGSGAIYIAGHTDAVDYPVVGAYQSFGGYSVDGFVTKMNPQGTALVYSTYLGGGADDYLYAIAVDTAGNAYVAGETQSSGFPGTSSSPIQPTFRGGVSDGFVTKLAASGSALVYSTYLGGNSSEGIGDLRVDATGAVYVVGNTTSANFPVTAGVVKASKPGLDEDAFVSKINPQGTALVYSTFLGGSSSDRGTGIAVDAAGRAFVTGYTLSTNFPGTSGSPIQPTNRGGYDGFLAALAPSAASLAFATYLGGTSTDIPSGVTLDAAGNAYVAGTTSSNAFPGAATSTIQPTPHGNNDAFLTKIAAAGTSIVYSTYLGGGGDDSAAALAVSPTGEAYVGGETASTTFPVAAAPQPSNRGGYKDMFVTKVNATGSSISYSTYLGTIGYDGCSGIALDSAGSAYVSGFTTGRDFPTVSPYQGGLRGTVDTVVVKLTEAADLSVSIAESADPVTPGSQLTYTLAVTNAGPESAPDVTVSSPVPAGTTLVSASSSQGTVGGSGTVDVAVGAMAPGATVTVTITLDVTAPAGSTITETATVASSIYDPTPATNSATETTSVEPDCEIVCPENLTVGTGAGASACGVEVAYPTPQTTGDCGGVTCTPASGSFFPVGTTTVSCESASGPSCGFTVTVVDDTPPVASGANVTLSAGAACQAIVPDMRSGVVASDNCTATGTLSITQSPAPGGTVGVGTHTITFTVTDAVGNTTTASSTLTVNDVTAPTIACPANVSTETTNVGGVAVSYPPATASDSCGAVALAYSHPSGTTFPIGTTTVTVTATDAAGNSSSCSFTVTVALELVNNGGFELGAQSWTQIPSSIVNNTGAPAYEGSWKARLSVGGGPIAAHLSQAPNFPAAGATRTLTFYLRISTETPILPKDRLFVRIASPLGIPLTTLATFTNAQHSTYANYTLVTLTIPAQYAVSGRRLVFAAEGVGLRSTDFYVDRVSIR